MFYKALSLLSVILSLGHSSPIYGGQDVGGLLEISKDNIVVLGQDQFPFMVYISTSGIEIKDGVKKRIARKCGGVIISEDAVLTAAHCIRDSVSRPAIFANAGLVHLKHESKTAFGSWTRGYVKHEEYKEHQTASEYSNAPYLNDIAIIWLEKPFTFDGLNVKIAELTTSDGPFDDQLGLIIGWGITSKGVPSQMLQKAQIRVIPKEQCQRLTPNLKITPDKFCLLSDNRTASSCVGDSGGPFIVGKTVYGISSFGSAKELDGRTTCDPTIPDKFTHVGMYKKWIEKKLQEGPKNVLKSLFDIPGPSSGASTSCAGVKRKFEENPFSNL